MSAPFKLHAGGTAQINGINQSSVGSADGVPEITPTANRLQLWVVLSRAGETPNQPTIAPVCGITPEVVATHTMTGSRRMTIFRGLTASPSSGTPTIDFGGQNQTNVLINLCESEVDSDTTGSNGSGAVVQSKVSNGTSTTPSATFDNALGDDNGVFAAVFHGTGTSITPEAGYDPLSDTLQMSGGNGGLRCEERGDNADNSPSFTLGANTAWRMIAIEVKPGTVDVPDYLDVTTEPVETEEDAAIPNVVVAKKFGEDDTTDTGYTGPVTVALGAGSGSATLSRVGGLSVNCVAGVATFTGLKIDNPGTGYTLVFTCPDATQAESAPFDITQLDADHLAFLSQPGDTQVDAIISPAITVRALDPEGKLNTSAAGNVTLARQAGTGILGGTLTRGLVNGVATFDDITYDTIEEDVQLRATHASLTLADSALFDVTGSPPPSTRRGFGIRMGSPLSMRL